MLNQFDECGCDCDSIELPVRELSSELTRKDFEKLIEEKLQRVKIYQESVKQIRSKFVR